MRQDAKGTTTTRFALRILAAAQLGLLAAASIAAPVQAASSHRQAPDFMQEGEEVRGPTGYYTLCARSPWDCPAPPADARGYDARVALDAATRSTLERVNRRENHAYVAVTDQELYGVSDHWTLPKGGADCEDYALAKRKALIAAGWPEAALLIGVVRGETTPYHAVLIARTSGGELVLDNLTDDIRDWRDSGYEWVVRQSLKDPNRWVRVLDGAPGNDRAGALQPATLSSDASTSTDE